MRNFVEIKSSSEHRTKKVSELSQFVINNDKLLSLTIVVLVIIAGVFFDWYNNKIIPSYASTSFHYTQEQNNPLSFMSNWDGPDYLSIAHSGYISPSDTNLFPLYPLIIKGVNFVIPSLLDSALLISWLCLIGAVYFYLKISKVVFNIKFNTEAVRSALFFILFPTGVFLIATYPESLFAFLALGSIYSALQNKYLAAGIFAMFATATHVTGILLLVLIGLILLEQKQKVSKVLAAVFIGSLGLVGYICFLWARFNMPFAFINSQVGQHGWLDNRLGNLLTTIDVFNLVFMILLILSMFYWWRKKKSFVVYSFLYLMIPIIGRQFGGFNRYMLLAFPVQLMLYGYLRDKKVGYLLFSVIISMAWMYFTLQYAAGYIGG
jgi:Gpi18-like mannosyltransferase